MANDVSNTFLWISMEGKNRESVCREIVDFADILEYTKVTKPDETNTRGSNILVDDNVDAVDGILAQERLDSAEWIDWSDLRRELQRQD